MEALGMVTSCNFGVSLPASYFLGSSVFSVLTCQSLQSTFESCTLHIPREDRAHLEWCHSVGEMTPTLVPRKFKGSSLITAQENNQGKGMNYRALHAPSSLTAQPHPVASCSCSFSSFLFSALGPSHMPLFPPRMPFPPCLSNNFYSSLRAHLKYQFLKKSPAPNWEDEKTLLSLHPAPLYFT